MIFCSIGILIQAKCQNVLTLLTYLDIRIHVCFILPASLLMLCFQSGTFLLRRTLWELINFWPVYWKLCKASSDIYTRKLGKKTFFFRLHFFTTTISKNFKFFLKKKQIVFFFKKANFEGIWEILFSNRLCSNLVIIKFQIHSRRKSDIFNFSTSDISNWQVIGKKRSHRVDGFPSIFTDGRKIKTKCRNWSKRRFGMLNLSNLEPSAVNFPQPVNFWNINGLISYPERSCKRKKH